MSFPAPREFQSRAHEALRDGVRAGHRCQVLMAATGAGKTYLGLRLAHEAVERGRRAVFVCDRTTLIDQTSRTADRYGLTDHGVVQADHWRAKPHAPLQIASVQTLARRQWPMADVVIVDECHTQHSAWVEHIQRTKAVVVGLSATPFSPGLGKLFSRVVNAATMHDLTRAGVLVPMRVLSCKRPDMTGAKTNSRGEWDEREVEKRGMGLIGDVVTEWIKHGEGRKTICFGATIAHCEELCRQFASAGVLAAVFSAHTPDKERASLLDEYRKPDSALRVLVSVEALAKGFDVPDVGCVIDCRPLRKSLSTAIQMWGRGLRASPETGKKDCVARGTLVLTDRGEVPIEHITLDHKVWDGENFVTHGGAVCKGFQAVIEYDGLIATPDHEVFTDDGWTKFEEAARRRRRIARTGIAGQPLRLADDLLAQRAGQRQRAARGGAVQSLWRDALHALSQLAQASRDGGLPALQCAPAGASAAVAVSALPSAIAALYEPAQQVIRAVRGAWHRVSVRLRQRSGALGCNEPRGCGSIDATGSGGQQRSLRTGQPPLVNAGRESEQHEGVGRPREVHRLSEGAPGREVCGRNVGEAHQPQTDGRADCGALGASISEAEREVWDVLNAGPLQRFTANGRLVHNCILLDHSGSVLRFRADFEDVYFNGLNDLDTGEKLDREVRKEPQEKEQKRCPVCGYSPFAGRCMSCGHEARKASDIEHEAGEMAEVVMLNGKRMGDNPAHVWAQVASYARTFSKPEKQQWRAAYLYRDITGTMPPRGWKVETTPFVEVSRPVLNKIQASNIAWKKARAAA